MVLPIWELTTHYSRYYSLGCQKQDNHIYRMCSITIAYIRHLVWLFWNNLPPLALWIVAWCGYSWVLSWSALYARLPDLSINIFRILFRCERVQAGVGIEFRKNHLIFSKLINLLFSWNFTFVTCGIRDLVSTRVQLLLECRKVYQKNQKCPKKFNSK